MIHKIYSVYDSKACAYLPPFLATTDAVALRMFTDAVCDQNHQFGKHADDYTLKCIGTFDDSVASIDSWSDKETLGNGLEVWSRAMNLDRAANSDLVEEEGDRHEV